VSLAKNNLTELVLSSSDFHSNVELSLLAFNERVLEMARDPKIPLFERFKFLCISCSNLDEIFEIKLAAIKQQVDLGLHDTGPDGLTPEDILQLCTKRARKLIKKQYSCLNKDLLPELASNKVNFIRANEFSKPQIEWARTWFEDSILPVVTPIRLDPAHPFPRTINKGLCLIIELHDPARAATTTAITEEITNEANASAKNLALDIAIIPAPRTLPRLIPIPKELCPRGETNFAFLASLIHASTGLLFPGLNVKGVHSFRVTRNSNLYVDPEEFDDLLNALQGELPHRSYGDAIRLEVSNDCPSYLIDFLQNQFQLPDGLIFQVSGPVNLNRLIDLTDMLPGGRFRYPAYINKTPPALQEYISIFDALKHDELLTHQPFESFSPVLDLLRQASEDPDVLSIKQTLYRTGKDSPILDILKVAAQRGKEVTAVIELMARFDEKNNISIASQLQAAGVHVVYGMIGQKTHAKMMLIVRRENNLLVKYAHLSTGNYHPGTARAYTDYGYFTCDKEITQDVQSLFIQLTTQNFGIRPAVLVQSPKGILDMLLDSIRREIVAATRGHKAKIIAKMNGLASQPLVEALYRASQAGVEIDLIVRGICTLRPGIKGVSDNIRVRSVLGRFLEHDRLYYFQNDGLPKVYISSADWMPRNLNKRVETCVPIRNETFKKRLIKNLKTYLSANQHTWTLNSKGEYDLLVPDENSPKVDAQQLLET
jgi:polyphosphate kinase